ncbi:MAG: site-specific integrase [Planctomycetaceae bacterium]|nr:site-specific integrase [Planctomycetaceae bacterium]
MTSASTVRKRLTVPGSIYLNGRRYWWRVRLPGQPSHVARPLVADGARFATTDRAAAVEIARSMYAAALARVDPEKIDARATVETALAAYQTYADQYYRAADGTPTGAADNVKNAIAHALEHFRTLPVADFDATALEAIRDRMIEEDYALNTINGRVKIIRRAFRWLAKRKIAPWSAYHSLTTLEPLQPRGRTEKHVSGPVKFARETTPVRPADESDVLTAAGYAGPVVGAMMRLQLLTGMRSGELVIMRAQDIDSSGKVWAYRPLHHKGTARGLSRVVALGPRAKKLLRPLLKNSGEYLFSPQAATRERFATWRAARKSPVQPSQITRKKERPALAPGPRYTTETYAQAVRYAIKAARKAGQTVGDFSPHQIRHAMGTRVRGQLGPEAAQAALGHRHLKTMEIYAALTWQKQQDVAQRMG